MIELLAFIGYLITLYIYIVLASVILSWLMGFGVVNPYNPFVRSLHQGLSAVTEPVLRPIRDALPNLGAIDISPMILLIGLIGIRDFFFPFLLRIMG